MSIVLGNPGERALMLGNEAIARGAIEGGVQVVAAYPGTPSSEIPETLIAVADEVGFKAQWSVNEKVAFEVAAGAALVGARALATMKGAGLNWTMDTLMTLPITGVRGGLELVVADDPGAHYSSNEQDSRLAAQWADIPCLEPEDQQEAKDMTRAAFALAEDLELPVMVRTVTRLSHGSGVVEYGAPESPRLQIGFNKHWKIPFRWNVYGPPGLVGKHTWQLGQLARARAWAERAPFNRLDLTGSRLGVAAAGIAAAYAREALRGLGLLGKVSFWKVGTVYPLPLEQAERFLRACDRVLVIEEGGALVEPQLRVLAQEHGVPVRIQGRQFEGPVPAAGELSIEGVRATLAAFCEVPLPDDAARRALKDEVRQLVIPRSSALCAGCPHLGTYWALRQALPQGARIVPILNGDIGCYEQAGYGVQGQMPAASDQPGRRDRSQSLYTMLDTLYVMGAGVALAQGERLAGYEDGPIVAVAGDSTFFHATLQAVANAVWNHNRLTFVVMDNSWTAMTGHQPSPTSHPDGERLTVPIDIEQAVKGLGVGWVRVVDPGHIEEAAAAIREALAFDGVAVVIARRECVLQVYRREKVTGRTWVEAERCDGCKHCIYLGCPAISYHSAKASIDPLLCVNCGICVQVCPQAAIVAEG